MCRGIKFLRFAHFVIRDQPSGTMIAREMSGTMLSYLFFSFVFGCIDGLQPIMQSHIRFEKFSQADPERHILN